MLAHGDLTEAVLTKKLLDRLRSEQEGLVNCVQETAEVMRRKVGVCLFANDAQKAMSVSAVCQNVETISFSCSVSACIC